MPAVSVIVTCYNQADYIVECLDSIMDSSFRDFEIIVVDDGSKDRSADVIQDYLCKHPNQQKIKLIEQKNRGVVAARNVAIEIACGEYILPVDGDDKITSGALEHLYNAVLAGRGDVICGITQYTGDREGIMELPQPTIEHDYLQSNPVICSALFRKSDWIKYGGYDSAMNKGLEDWEFWLNFAEERKRFHRINYITYIYRILPKSRNQSFSALAHKKLIDYMCQKHNKLAQRRNCLMYMETGNPHILGCGIAKTIISSYLKQQENILPTVHSTKVNLICGGTYAANSIDDKFMVLLGCGVLPVDSVGSVDKLKIYALRGELSYKALGITHKNVMGDVTLLLPYLYPKCASVGKKTIGIVCALEHYEAPELERFRHNPNFRVICSSDSPRALADEINACSSIVSSSLEGLMIADAYQIPNLRMIIPEKPVAGGDFIFLDYYSSIGREGKAALNITPKDITENMALDNTSYILNILKVQEKLDGVVRQFVCDLENLKTIARESQQNTAKISSPEKKLWTLAFKVARKKLRKKYNLYRFLSMLSWGDCRKACKKKKEQYKLRIRQIRAELDKL